MGDGNTQYNTFVRGENYLLPKPFQLPRASNGIEGRTDESRRIEKTLLASEAAASRLVIISGSPGMGKTALALKVATTIQSNFPDGALFADLRGFQANALEPEGLLRHFLLSLGVPVDLVKADGLDLAGVYQTLMTGTRRLIVLDNARSANQFRDVLPAESKCSVLVTSRYRLSDLRPDLRVLLGPLEDDDAARVLGPYFDSVESVQQSELTKRLAEWCNNWPLALHIVGGRLKDRPLGAVNTYILAMNSTEKGPGTLRFGALDFAALIDETVRNLSSSARRLFAGLGVIFTDHFPAWIAKAILGPSDANPSGALEELVEANLVNYRADQAEESYFLHDLVKDAAREFGVGQETGREILTRILREYASRGRVCRHHVEPGRPPYGGPDERQKWAFSPQLDIADPEAWLINHKADLIAAVDVAYVHGLDALGVEIANCLPTYFIIRGTWNEWGACYRTGIRAALRSGDLAGQGYLLQGLANVQRTVGDGLGDESLRMSLECFMAADDAVGASYVRNDLGLIDLYIGEWDRAERLFQVSFEGLEQAGYRLMALQVVRNRALALLEAGDAAHAVPSLVHAAEALEAGGDQRWSAYTRADVGTALGSLGRFGEAAETLSGAIERLVGIGDVRWAAVTRIKLGEIHRRMNDLSRAIEDYEAAAQTFDQLDDPVWGARVAVSKSVVQVATGDTSGAVSACEAGVDVFGAFGLRYDECWAWTVYSRIQAAAGDPEAGGNARSRAVNLARQLGRGADLLGKFETESFGVR